MSVIIEAPRTLINESKFSKKEQKEIELVQGLFKKTFTSFGESLPQVFWLRDQQGGCAIVSNIVVVAPTEWQQQFQPVSRSYIPDHNVTEADLQVVNWVVKARRSLNFDAYVTMITALCEYQKERASRVLQQVKGDLLSVEEEGLVRINDPKGLVCEELKQSLTLGIYDDGDVSNPDILAYIDARVFYLRSLLDSGLFDDAQWCNTISLVMSTLMAQVPVRQRLAGVRVMSTTLTDLRDDLTHFIQIAVMFLTLGCQDPESISVATPLRRSPADGLSSATLAAAIAGGVAGLRIRPVADEGLRQILESPSGICVQMLIFHRIFYGLFPSTSGVRTEFEDNPFFYFKDNTAFPLVPPSAITNQYTHYGKTLVSSIQQNSTHIDKLVCIHGWLLELGRLVIHCDNIIYVTGTSPALFHFRPLVKAVERTLRAQEDFVNAIGDNVNRLRHLTKPHENVHEVATDLARSLVVITHRCSEKSQKLQKLLKSSLFRCRNPENSSVLPPEIQDLILQSSILSGKAEIGLNVRPPPVDFSAPGRPLQPASSSNQTFDWEGFQFQVRRRRISLYKLEQKQQSQPQPLQLPKDSPLSHSARIATTPPSPIVTNNAATDAAAPAVAGGSPSLSPVHLVSRARAYSPTTMKNFMNYLDEADEGTPQESKGKQSATVPAIKGRELTKLERLFIRALSKNFSLEDQHMIVGKHYQVQGQLHLHNGSPLLAIDCFVRALELSPGRLDLANAIATARNTSPVVTFSQRAAGLETGEVACQLLPCQTLQRVDLTANQLGALALPSIFTVFRWLPALTSLSLGSNNITDEGLKSITAFLSGSALTDLDISCNGITSAGAQQLAAVLSTNIFLKQLNVSGNPLQEAGAAALCAACFANAQSALELLDLRDTGLDPLLSADTMRGWLETDRMSSGEAVAAAATASVTTVSTTSSTSSDAVATDGANGIDPTPIDIATAAAATTETVAVSSASVATLAPPPPPIAVTSAPSATTIIATPPPPPPATPRKIALPPLPSSPPPLLSTPRHDPPYIHVQTNGRWILVSVTKKLQVELTLGPPGLPLRLSPPRRDSLVEAVQQIREELSLVDRCSIWRQGLFEVSQPQLREFFEQRLNSHIIQSSSVPALPRVPSPQASPRCQPSSPGHMLLQWFSELEAARPRKPAPDTDVACREMLCAMHTYLSQRSELLGEWLSMGSRFRLKDGMSGFCEEWKDWILRFYSGVKPAEMDKVTHRLTFLQELRGLCSGIRDKVVIGADGERQMGPRVPFAPRQWPALLPLASPHFSHLLDVMSNTLTQYLQREEMEIMRRRYHTPVVNIVLAAPHFLEVCLVFLFLVYRNPALAPPSECVTLSLPALREALRTVDLAKCARSTSGQLFLLLLKSSPLEYFFHSATQVPSLDSAVIDFDNPFWEPSGAPRLPRGVVRPVGSIHEDGDTNASSLSLICQHEGYLGKATTGLGYLRRYFILHLDKLYYYKERNDLKPADVLSLGRETVVQEDPSSGNTTFFLITERGGERRLFAAETENAKMEWLHKIRANINTIAEEKMKADATAGIRFRGYLWKTGSQGLKTTFKKRFVVLSDDRLRYFVTHDAEKPKGEVMLSGQTEIMPVHDSPRPNTFYLETERSGRKFYFAAETDYKEWLNAITICCADLRNEMRTLNVDEEVLFSGYLLKQGESSMTKYQKRFFRLYSGKLVYFAKENEAKKGEVILTPRSLVSPIKDSKRAFSFFVASSPTDRKYIMAAEDAQTLAQWMEALKNVIEGGAQQPMGRVLPTMKGWLGKTGTSGLKKGFSRRYCILTHDKFQYFKSINDRKPKGEIFILPTTTCTSSLYAAPNVFQWVNPDRTYYFQCENNTERVQWIHAINSRLKKIDLPKSPPPPPSKPTSPRDKEESKEDDHPIVVALGGLDELCSGIDELSVQRDPQKLKNFVYLHGCLFALAQAFILVRKLAHALSNPNFLRRASAMVHTNNALALVHGLLAATKEQLSAHYDVFVEFKRKDKCVPALFARLSRDMESMLHVAAEINSRACTVLPVSIATSDAVVSPWLESLEVELAVFVNTVNLCLPAAYQITPREAPRPPSIIPTTIVRASVPNVKPLPAPPPNQAPPQPQAQLEVNPQVLAQILGTSEPKERAQKLAALAAKLQTQNARAAVGVYALAIECDPTNFDYLHALAKASRASMKRLLFHRSSLQDCDLSRVLLLIQDHVIVELDVSNNFLGPVAIAELCTALLQCEKLKQLSLAENRIGDDDQAVKSLVELMRRHPALEHVNLSGLQLTDLGLQIIADSLKYNRTLLSLDVSGNPVGDSGVVMVCESLQANSYSTVERLNFSRTQVSDVGGRCLRTLLAYAAALEEVGLEGCDMSPPIVEEITARLNLKRRPFEALSPKKRVELREFRQTVLQESAQTFFLRFFDSPLSAGPACRALRAFCVPQKCYQLATMLSGDPDSVLSVYEGLVGLARLHFGLGSTWSNPHLQADVLGCKVSNEGASCDSGLWSFVLPDWSQGLFEASTKLLEQCLINVENLFELSVEEPECMACTLNVLAKFVDRGGDPALSPEPHVLEILTLRNWAALPACKLSSGLLTADSPLPAFLALYSRETSRVPPPPPNQIARENSSTIAAQTIALVQRRWEPMIDRCFYEATKNLRASPEDFVAVLYGLGEEGVPHSGAIPFFSKFLTGECSQENMDFWFAMNHFLKHPLWNVLEQKHGDDEEAKKVLWHEARDIAQTFIGAGAARQVNIASSLESDTKKALALEEGFKYIFEFKAVLTRAREEVIKLMTADSFRRFVRSSFWSEYLATGESLESCLKGVRALGTDLQLIVNHVLPIADERWQILRHFLVTYEARVTKLLDPVERSLGPQMEDVVATVHFFDWASHLYFSLKAKVSESEAAILETHRQSLRRRMMVHINALLNRTWAEMQKNVLGVINNERNAPVKGSKKDGFSTNSPLKVMDFINGSMSQCFGVVNVNAKAEARLAQLGVHAFDLYTHHLGILLTEAQIAFSKKNALPALPQTTKPVEEVDNADEKKFDFEATLTDVVELGETKQTVMYIYAQASNANTSWTLLDELKKSTLARIAETQKRTNAGEDAESEDASMFCGFDECFLQCRALLSPCLDILVLHAFTRFSEVFQDFFLPAWFADSTGASTLRMLEFVKQFFRHFHTMTGTEGALNYPLSKKVLEELMNEYAARFMTYREDEPINNERALQIHAQISAVMGHIRQHFEQILDSRSSAWIQSELGVLECIRALILLSHAQSDHFDSQFEKFRAKLEVAGSRFRDLPGLSPRLVLQECLLNRHIPHHRFQRRD